MPDALPETLFPSCSRFIAAEMGLSLPKERWRDLERGMACAAGEFGFRDPASCAAWLMSSRLNRTQDEILASHLTVGETYFFREAKTFAALENQILPELIRSRQGTDRRLRLWSAGCATGEEPYFLAILLNKMLGNLGAGISPSWRATSIRDFFSRPRKAFTASGRSASARLGSEIPALGEPRSGVSSSGPLSGEW